MTFVRRIVSYQDETNLNILWQPHCLWKNCKIIKNDKDKNVGSPYDKDEMVIN